MMKLILSLLPARYRNAVELATRLTANLDTQAERDAALATFVEIMRDGQITPPEWSQLGKTLKIWKQRGPGRPRKDEDPVVAPTS